MQRLPPAVIGVWLVAMCTGCTTVTERGSWGANAHWPSGKELRRAAADAATDPMTWIPLAGAAALAVTDLDDDLSDWAAEEQPLFGSNANDVSDDLRNLATVAYAATALLAPKPKLADKAKGVAVGMSAMAITEGITRAGKSLSNRERPNGQDDKSFPSGHASNATVRYTLAAANVDYLPLPQWAASTLKVGFYGLAGGTAWARVEAEKHYTTDVLVGYALGHFIARFMHNAFLEPRPTPLTLRFAPHPSGGGAITLRYPLGGP